MTYREFLESKIELATDSGFEVDKSRINKALKPHQSDAVAWALKGGRRALFESFGLGKTAQEIEFCHLAAEHTGGRALIVLPLGVKQEFTRDAVELLGYEKPEYCRTMEEVEASTSQIVLTNYERVRDGDIDPSYFVATSLDEASVLRSFGSKTYQTFLDKFKNVPYKLVATATPSPNKYKELIHYAGYLEVMDTGQALTRFFQRDSTKANNLTLYPNMEDEFWLWVSSWALFITKPSDLNPDYSDDGYVLPPLDVRWHEIPIHYGDSVDRDGQMELFTQASTGLKEAAKIKRESIDARVEKMKEIVDSSPEDHFILWHDQEAERHAIKKVLPETVDIYGSMDYDLREQRVIDFSNGKTRLFATKKSISGSGCNFQRFCHREIFVGIDYEFNDFIQAVHRCYRFLQQDTVVIDIIYMENEREIKDALIEKWKNHNHMVKKMIEIVKKYGLDSANKTERLERKMGVGCPEYILLFRKLPTDHSKAYADDPVTKSKDEYTRAQWQIDAHGYWRSSGDRLISKEELEGVSVDNLQRVYRQYSREHVYNYEEHVALAKYLDTDGRLPATFMVVAPGSWNQLEVWDDINRMRTLNTTQSRRRATMHVCPLQLDIVERIINRYSNPGDVVYDPFGGLMTVPMMAVKMHRFGKGCELNPDYFRDGVGYLQSEENEVDSPTLFDFIDGGME